MSSVILSETCQPQIKYKSHYNNSTATAKNIAISNEKSKTHLLNCNSKEAELESRFISLYPKIVEVVVNHSEHKDMEGINSWMTKLMDYNVPNGKKMRGLLTTTTFLRLNLKESMKISEDELDQICILGWCVELLHAAFRINTDIIYGNEKRRGQASWHNTSENLGPAAFNDAILLTGALYYLLKVYFEDEEYYKELLDGFHEAQLFRSFGQSLKRKTNLDKEYNYLNPSRYEAIVKYETSYFSYYFPVSMAFLMCEFDQKSNQSEIIEESKNILEKIGFLSQVVMDSKNLKKDISNNTPNWFLFQALFKSKKNQKRNIAELYGKKDEVSKVLNIYNSLELNAEYVEFIKTETVDIENLINNFDEKYPKSILNDLLKSVL